MTRKHFKPAAWALPQPVSIIGTYDEHGTPNAMNAAWTGQYDDTQVALCLSAGHKTTKNIMARRDFTLSFATKDQVTACDYVGMVSGNTTPDKVARTGWTVSRAGHVDAPVFAQLPLTLECRMTGRTENGNIILSERMTLNLTHPRNHTLSKRRLHITHSTSLNLTRTMSK